MHALKNIRLQLGATQSEIAEALDVTQGNVSFYEKGQTIPPAQAEKLIAYARGKGLSIGYDHVYGLAELPTPTQQTQE